MNFSTLNLYKLAEQLGLKPRRPHVSKLTIKQDVDNSKKFTISSGENNDVRFEKGEGRNLKVFYGACGVKNVKYKTSEYIDTISSDFKTITVRGGSFAGNIVRTVNELREYANDTLYASGPV